MRSITRANLFSSRRLIFLPGALVLALTLFSSVARAGINGGGGGNGVPEIDPGSALSAVTILTGGILLITDRIRKSRSSG